MQELKSSRFIDCEFQEGQWCVRGVTWVSSKGVGLLLEAVPLSLPPGLGFSCLTLAV